MFGLRLSWEDERKSTTHESAVCRRRAAVTWIFTRSRLSSLSDSDYKVIPSLKFII